jgi:prepilin-type N-terminal cleavage/methylation domain-containing protein
VIEIDLRLMIKFKEQTPLSINRHLPLKKGEVLRKKGFTLVELLVVMAIIGFLVAVVTGALNPIVLVNKAKDSRRKNDLNKIRIAFEAYFANKGYYPIVQDVLEWNKVENCDKTIEKMAAYLKTLPCDPNKHPYEIVTINDNTFKVITNLDYKKDKDIPVNWYLENTYPTYRERKDQVNYGVSSSNILWYESEGEYDSFNCAGTDCLIKIGGAQPVRVDNGKCVAGGSTWCFLGQPSGNIIGTRIPGIVVEPQCYVDQCCDGSGCN